VQSTVQWPGAGAWAGSAWEPPDALAAAVSAQRIRVSAVSGCSPCLYLAIMSLDPTAKGRKRRTNRWKAALNAFDIT
jgi:hypothetical protein